MTTKEWISVEDRLPEPNQRILFFSTVILLGTYTLDHKFTNDRGWPYHATHWMPLPESPK